MRESQGLMISGNQAGTSSLQESKAGSNSDMETRQGQEGMKSKLKQMRHKSQQVGGLG